ncbi:MAG: hypothetical protein ACO3SO_11530 [Luteolibacter sp.]
MKQKHLMLPILAFSVGLIACGEKKSGHDHPHDDHDHPHGEGNVENREDHGDHDHGEETELGSFKVGDLDIQAAQAHGSLAAGKEGHLVIKLPYKDGGSSIVRAWIGTEDRTLSQVGKGVYTPSHDDYDIHTMAPSPLPEGVKWWVEVQKPDGTKLVGSVTPKL